MKQLATIGLTLLLLALVPGRAARAQGTTASMTGVVITESGETLPGANVVAVHEPTGTQYGTVTNSNGRYNLLNMRVGGPYTVTVSFVGYQTQRETGIILQLSENQTLNFELTQATEQLEEIEVIAERDAIINQNRTGAATNVSQEQIEELPTINRSITDFARLIPQYSGDGSFAGANDRYNSIQVDGATLDDVFGLGEAVPGSQAGTQPISLDAIKEINVDIAPFDVRNSGFTGGQINAITKSGTNEFSGLVHYLGRSEQLTGDLNGVGTGEFGEQYFVGNIGGPIVRNKLFFFVNAEIVRQNNPLNTQLGDANAPNTFDLSESLLDRFGYESTEGVVDAIRTAAQEVYGYQPGGTQPITQEQNSNKLLVKLDWNIAPNHRLTLRNNYVYATDDDGIGRSNEAFDLSNRQYQFQSTQNSLVAQLNSSFGNNMFNEARVVYTRIRDERVVEDAAFPDIELEFDNNREINMGIDRFSQANSLNQDLIEITNNFSYVWGDHTFTIGTNNDIWQFENLFIQDYFGQYEFNAFELPDGTIVDPVEAFRRGQPVEYRFSYATEAAGTAKPVASFTAFEVGAYVQDEWQAMRNLRLTAGLRLDVPIVPNEPTFNPAAQDAFGRSTSNVASGNLLFSPRFGFNYSMNALQENLTTQVRGGVGLFAGNPPFVWISNQFSNTGADLNRIDADFVPPEDFYGPGTDADGARFVPTTIGENPTDQPRPGEGNALEPIATTEINLISEGFKYPQVLRTNLAIDQELPEDFVLTLEGLYSNTVNGILYRNINIRPVNPSAAGAPYALGATKYGRPIYGPPGQTDPVRVSEQFTNALLLENTNEGYSYSATIQLQRRVPDGLNGSIAYTYAENKAVNSGNSSRAISNWQFNEAADPNHPRLGTTDYLVRHRIVGDLTYRLSYGGRFATSIGLIYEGRSGLPFSWIYNGNANGDTRDDNDLVYVPEERSDIVLESGNWNEMNAFIESEDALDEARGAIIRRNTATAPWQNLLDVQVSQEIATFAGQRIEITATMENALNWLNEDWGRIETVSFSNQVAWDLNGYVTPDDVGTRIGGRVMTVDDVGKPRVSFDQSTINNKLTGDLYNLADIASRWRVQFGIRYTF